MLEFFPKTTVRDVLRKYLIYFPIGVFAVLVVFWVIARLEYQRVNLLVASQELSNLRQVQFVVSHDLEMLADDLKILAGSDSLSNYLKDPSERTRNDLNNSFRSFAKDKKNYRHVSYLDRNGQEIVRIDLGLQVPEPATDNNPQKREGRYDDREALRLKRGDMSISLLEPGSENGGSGKPFAPVFRVAVPILDGFGQPGGTVLFTYRAERLLNRISQIFPEQDGSRFTVVDNDGHWLNTDRLEKASPVLERADLWAAMQSRQSGQLLTAEGLFTFATLFPVIELREAAGGRPEQDTEKNGPERQDSLAWHLITYIPAAELSFIRILRQHANIFWVVPLALAAVAAGALHLAIVLAKKERSDRSLKLLSTALEQSPAAAVITDIDGRIQYANPKFLAMSGYERAEIIGENPRIFKSGETSAEVYEDLWRTIHAGREWAGEFLNRRKDATHYIVSAKISPILQKSGEICGFLAIQEDVTETRRLQRQLEHMATIDGLTGAYNRSHFLHLFGQELRRAERYGQPLCLLVFDLDNFKSINDNFGHQAGDRVLEAFARVVSSALRDSDLFGRLGGEEFGVVMMQTDHDGARLLAARLRAAVEKMSVTSDDSTIRVTVSIGGTRWERDDRQIEPVLHRADKALYEAKRNGRNQVCFRFAADGNVWG